MNHFYLSLLNKTSDGYARYLITRNEQGEADDLRIVEANQAYETMMGADRSENIIGRKVSELDHLIPDCWPVESIKFYDRTARSNNNLAQTIKFEVESMQKFYQVIVVPLSEDEVICRYHNITQIKDDYRTLRKLEHDLTEQLALSSLFFTHSIASLFYMMIDDPIEWNDDTDKGAVLDYVFDHHRITRVNPAMETQYRTTADNLVGITARDLFDNDVETCKKVWTELFDRGRAQVYTEKQRFDRTKMAIKGDYISLYDDVGRITGLYGIQVDITAQKEAEDALLENSELYRFSQELGKVGGFDYNLKTGKLRWTEEMYRIHDLIAAETDNSISLMDTTLNCLEPGDRKKLNQAIEELRICGERFDMEVSLTTASGNSRWVRITARSAGQNPDRLVGSMMEITQHKETEIKLQKALEAAKINAQSKTMFLASMSHEIRNPVHGILGMLQLMETTPLNNEQQELMQLSQNSSDKLLRIIDDILDYSKIEAGALILEESPFFPRDALKEVHDTFEKLAACKGLDIILNIDDSVPDVVKGDSYRFSQVMNNLMSNAMKYTKEGEIRIHTSLEDSDGEEITLKVSITDTGVGIPEGKIDLLFQVFTQADPSHTRLYGGTGLGLAIAKNIVEHMGGKIWAESMRGKGSTFTFTTRMKSVAT